MAAVGINECYNAAVEVVKIAGKVIQEAFHKSKTVEMKQSNVDFVTETDIKVEELLKSTFLSTFPGHFGTVFAVVIVIRISLHLYLYWSCCKQTNLSEALVIADCGSTRTKESLDQMFANFRQVTEKAHGLQILGSAALNMCMVASGEGDAYFEYTLHCWDMAAEKIIVEEAGGVKSYLCLFSTACYITLQTAATHLTPKRQIIKCGTKKVHIWEVEKFSSIVQQVLSLSYST
ncbi:hypothetical protein JTE90_005536 [Oedothorax gibbosus]|uniref:Inositol monophosphatase n=1 Tax=Oedothorax gibbosus TaxID=931172 RepID=A0AAV6VBY7_9ARAC|nr:hypothetical protein JTE90_005536 [Oedothorax gibbosus]